MSTRIRANALALTFGGTDYWADATSVLFENEETATGVTTFEDASLGGARTYFFTISAVQSTATSSFWRYLWENTGDVVAYKYAVHGNATATADEPHLTGTVKIGPKPSLGGDASVNGEYTFTVRLDAQEEPTLDTGV